MIPFACVWWDNRDVGARIDHVAVTRYVVQDVDTAYRGGLQRVAVTWRSISGWYAILCTRGEYASGLSLWWLALVW